MKSSSYFLVTTLVLIVIFIGAKLYIERTEAGKPAAKILSPATPTPEEPNDSTLSSGQASILVKRSTCVIGARLGTSWHFDEISRTWWFDMIPVNPREGCRMTCSVDDAAGTADVHWTCVE